MLTTAGDNLSSPDMVPADRGGHDHDSDSDDDDCVAQDEVLVGPVCVSVDDVISDILTT